MRRMGVKFDEVFGLDCLNRSNVAEVCAPIEALLASVYASFEHDGDGHHAVYRSHDSARGRRHWYAEGVL